MNIFLTMVHFYTNKTYTGQHAIFEKVNLSNIRKSPSHFLRGCRQIGFVTLNGKLAVKGGRWSWSMPLKLFLCDENSH
jgi:hypothetical protein